MVYKECTKIWRAGISEKSISNLFVKLTYCSNKIDNDETRLSDVEAIFSREEVHGFNGVNRAIKEIENHKELFESIFKLIKENRAQLSLNLIRHFHYVLTKECFCEELAFKSEKCRGELQESEVDILEVSLKSLVDEVNEVQINDNNALEIVSGFYCCFLNKCPFCGVTGRVGRMILNYLLMGNNLPPILIFPSDREQHNLALEYYNKTRKTDKMINFFDEQAYKTWIKNYNLKTRYLKEFLD